MSLEAAAKLPNAYNRALRHRPGLWPTFGYDALRALPASLAGILRNLYQPVTSLVQNLGHYSKGAKLLSRIQRAVSMKIQAYYRKSANGTVRVWSESEAFRGEFHEMSEEEFASLKARNPDFELVEVLE